MNTQQQTKQSPLVKCRDASYCLLPLWTAQLQWLAILPIFFIVVCIHYSKEDCIPKYLGQQSTCTRCPRRWYLCFKFGLLNVSIQPIHFLVRILSLSKNHSLPLNWSQIGYTGQIFCWASLHLQMARIFSVAEQRNKRINVHNIWALTSKDDIPCMNVTCDRQTRWRANN